jgi:signal transduction histidine kinase
MMSTFLANNHDDLIAHCRSKVVKRPQRDASSLQLSNGVPLFLDQLRQTLRAEEGNQEAESMRISGASGGDALLLSEMAVSAAAHGQALLALGFSVDQVVHDYGDLCQAITDLAFERDAPFSVPEFRTLNRCLDNAIASAVSAFSRQRDEAIARRQGEELNERVGLLVHELRNALASASYATAALELGNLPMSGSTGAVLKRALESLKKIVGDSLEQVRAKAGEPGEQRTFSLQSFIGDARNDALLHAAASGSRLTVPAVDPLLEIHGDRERLLGALANVLQNAFKFTRPQTEVSLIAYAVAEQIFIDVKDHCGGLPGGNGGALFSPFSQRGADRTGLGLGLSVARASVEADGGVMAVRNVPGTGCVFTITLPRHH